jgi:hypothetical protein
MNRTTFLFLPLNLFLVFSSLTIFSQRKVKVKYEYEVFVNDSTHKEEEELQRQLMYDANGNIMQITTYGREKCEADTTIKQTSDGNEQYFITFRKELISNDVASIESITYITDSTMQGKGFQLFSPEDSIPFVTSYKKINSNLLAVLFDFKKENYCVNNYSFCSNEFESRYFSDSLQYSLVSNNVDLLTWSGYKQYHFYNNQHQLTKDSSSRNDSCWRVIDYVYDQHHLVQTNTTYYDGLKPRLNVDYYLYNAAGFLEAIKHTFQRRTLYTELIKYEYWP